MRENHPGDKREHLSNLSFTPHPQPDSIHRPKIIRPAAPIPARVTVAFEKATQNFANTAGMRPPRQDYPNIRKILSGENHPGVRHRVSIAPTHLLQTIFAPETAGCNHPPSLTPDSFSIRCTAHPQKCNIHPNTLPARIRLCCFSAVHML